jgi:hypothetical protein
MSRRSASLLLASLGLLAGCSRQKWHQQADDTAYAIVKERYLDERWANPRMDVIADPRSRFYDANDADCAPLPPDDESAHLYMHRVWGIKGYKKWHDFGDLDAIENPTWMDPFGYGPQNVTDNFKHNGTYPEIRDMRLGEAVELAYLHSRDYQTQVENVFLTALAVSFERFRFQVQFVGFTANTPMQITNGNKPGFTNEAQDLPGIKDGVTFGPTAGIQQLTPWGSQWLVGLANSTLWLWADGKATDASTSTLSYSLVQPLLAGAGKRVVLENLTQAERNMLYAVRDFARYRMGFFGQIVVGGPIAGSSSGSGGVSAGVGTGVTPITSPVLQNGYLGLLQQAQIIANQEFNIRLLLSNLEKTRNRVSQPRRPYAVLDELPSGLEIPAELGDVVFYRREPMLDESLQPIRDEQGNLEMEGRLYITDRLTDAQREDLVALSNDPKWRSVVQELVEKSGQATRNQDVAQLETQLASLYTSLRQNRTTLQNNIDNYKITLGLPTSMPISVNRDLLKPFELVDPKLTRLADRLDRFVPDPGDLDPSHPDYVTMQRVAELMKRLDPSDPDQQVLQGLVLELFVLRDDIARDAIGPMKTNYNDALRILEKRGGNQIKDAGLEPYDAKKFRELRDRQMVQFDLLDQQLQNLRNKVLERGLSPDARKAIAAEVNDLREDMLALSQGVTGTEVNLRMELIELNPFDMEMEEAVEIALDNRLDLKNVQAFVMDARRKVEVAANQLKSVLNITAAGDIRTKPVGAGNDNPFAFRGDESNIRLGVQFTTPIQLVQQRNTYRAVLIGYQQARRNFMRVEDQVKLDVRTAWRNIDLFRQNFETAKANLRAAVIQYDIAVDRSNAPTGATPAGGGGGAMGGGGNQGLNILNALRSLLDAQNQLIQIWVSYEQNRINIHNSMGVLTLDEQGFWTDDFYQREKDLAGLDANGVYRPGFGPDFLPPDFNVLPPGTPEYIPLPSEDLNNAAPQFVPQGPLPPQARRKPGREKRIQYAQLGGSGRPLVDDVVSVRGSSPEVDRHPGRSGTGRGGLGGRVQ